VSCAHILLHTRVCALSYNFTRWRYSSNDVTQQFLVTATVRFYLKDAQENRNLTRCACVCARAHMCLQTSAKPGTMAMSVAGDMLGRSSLPDDGAQRGHTMVAVIGPRTVLHCRRLDCYVFIVNVNHAITMNTIIIVHLKQRPPVPWPHRQHAIALAGPVRSVCEHASARECMYALPTAPAHIANSTDMVLWRCSRPTLA
jgi:hypothetical protein